MGTRFGFALWMLAGLTYAQTGRDGYPPLGKLVDAGGHRVHVYCTGAGAQTVMIAGSGFSFDWGLVQPEIARFARVCSYDPSGTAWSDPNPTASCTQRIDEIRMVMRRAGIHGPVILVGHSIGGAMARLYAARYPKDVAGMVIVDHAGRFQVPQGMPMVARSFDHEAAFQKLPALNQRLHRWAAALPGGSTPAPVMFPLCMAQLEEATTGRPSPLGNMPLVVVSNGVFQGSAGYRKLQGELLALSHHSKELVAAKSGHAIQIDQPEVIVDAVRWVVDALRNGR